MKDVTIIPTDTAETTTRNKSMVRLHFVRQNG